MAKQASIFENEITEDQKKYFASGGEAEIPDTGEIEAPAADDAAKAETERKAAEDAAKAKAEKETTEAAKNAEAEKKAEEHKGKPKDDIETQVQKINAALKEAREETRQEKRERKAEIERHAAEIANFRKFQEAVTKVATEKPAPKFEDDPLGNLKSENETLRKELEGVKTSGARTAESISQERQWNEFHATVLSNVNAFKGVTPDYDEAYRHVYELQRASLEVLGVPENEMGKALDAWETNLAAVAMRSGRNPGQVLYDMAQKLGYKANQAKPAGASKAAKDLETIAAGQRAAASLSGGGGGDSDFSLESIAQMDTATLEDFVRKNWDRIERTLH